jgi:YVTN family beta-propeller protein
VVDVDEKTVIREMPVGRHPTHAVLSRDGRALFVTCLHDNVVAVVDLETGQVVRRLPTGYEPTGLTLSSDERRLSVANALADTVSVFDVSTGVRLHEIPVGRVPRYLTETPDGKRLIVANAHSRDLSIIDTATGEVIETRSLGRGAQLRHVICTRDGRWAFVALLVGHDEMVTTQMERGWINSNGFAVVDLHEPGHYRLLLLDRLLSGATNPWALAMSTDEQRLYVSLAGIHQVAIVDIPRTLELAARTKPEEAQRLSQDVEILERLKIARRVEVGGVGPRGLAVSEATGELWVANCFTDDVSVLDAETGEIKAKIALGPKQELTLWREGEMYFNDGRICYQNWNSCASCHQEDATIDSLNWDLINDGTGNPKNAKSMHDGILTPPAMWSGVRTDQHAAVMAGQRFLGFLPDDHVQDALFEYIGNPCRAPNPYRQADVEAIMRGERIFYRARCDMCHVPPLLTDMKTHDIGLTGYTTDVDFRSRFDTPTLQECYRTAPYLHDGRAATLLEIFTDHNPENAHGLTGGLSGRELDYLVAYLKSL